MTASTATQAARSHWLVDCVKQGNVAGSRTLEIASNVSVEDAWQQAATGCRMSELELAYVVASYFRLQVANLDSAEPQAQKLVPETTVTEHNVLPLRQTDRELYVATSDPTNMEVEQALSFASGRTTVFEITPPQALQDALKQKFSPNHALEDLLNNLDSEVTDSVHIAEELAPEAIAETEAEATPIIKLANLILSDAVKQNASDIHIGASRQGGCIKFRVDGVLRQYMQIPMAAVNRVISRIKVLGKLDIADRVRPQDGKARIEVHGRMYDIRISTVPTRDSEKAVLRILNTEQAPRLGDLGMPREEYDRFKQQLGYSDGIILVTGPTGSGKTTTLYAALRKLASGESNIVTVEDPIEYELPEVTQIQVDRKRGLTFASALRAVLRQDPDVILVGEIRDLETAEIAVQASMSGHLVLATLHTNDAVGSIGRLVDLGLDRAALGETLRGSVAQRLVRNVCRECAENISGPLNEQESRLADTYGVTPIVRTVGCDECGGSGFRGRAPVLEVMTSSPALQEVIARGASHPEIMRAAVAGGMRPMRQVAMEFVREGKTSLQEIERVLGDVVDDQVPDAPAKPRVLLVDDDPVVRKMAKGILIKQDFDVTEVGDGITALECIESESDFSLMVLDVDMPRMSGPEVLTRLRSSVTTVGLPVIVLTGSSDPALETTLMDKGADDYIRKPIDAPRFISRVKATLRRAA